MALLAKVQAYIHTHICFKWHTFSQHTHACMLEVTQTHRTTYTYLNSTHPQHNNTHTHTCSKWHRPTKQLHTHACFTIKWHRPTDQQHTLTHTPASSDTDPQNNYTHTHTLHFTIKWHKPTEQQHTHTHLLQATHRTTTSTHMHASSETETHRTATGHLPESWLWFAWRWHGAEGQGQWGRTAWRMARPARSDPVCPACCLDVESEHTHTPVHCQQCVVHPLPPTPYLSLTSNCLECDIWTYIHTHGH